MIQCNTIQYYTIQYNTIQLIIYHTFLYCNTQEKIVVTNVPPYRRPSVSLPPLGEKDTLERVWLPVCDVPCALNCSTV